MRRRCKSYPEPDIQQKNDPAELVDEDEEKRCEGDAGRTAVTVEVGGTKGKVLKFRIRERCRRQKQTPYKYQPQGEA